MKSTMACTHLSCNYSFTAGFKSNGYIPTIVSNITEEQDLKDAICTRKETCTCIKAVGSTFEVVRPMGVV